MAFVRLIHEVRKQALKIRYESALSVDMFVAETKTDDHEKIICHSPHQDNRSRFYRSFINDIAWL